MTMRFFTVTLTGYLVFCSFINTAYTKPTSDNQKAHHFAYYGRDRERITEENFINSPSLEGAQLLYAWSELESDEGTYDFSEIQKDLDFLRSKGKKLFVQLQDTTFSISRTVLPKYLTKNPKFNGGAVYQYDDQGKPEGWALRRWDPAVRARLHALLAALGKALDGKIEGIALQETAIGVSPTGPNAAQDFTYEGYRDAILSNMEALKRSFPRSVAMQYANYMPGEWLPNDDHSYLRSVFLKAKTLGMAIGAPDLMPNHLSQQNHTYKFMHELGGTLMTGVAVQDGNYSGKTNDDSIPKEPWPNLVPKLFEFATQFLHSQYIFWGAQEPYFSHDVVPYLKRIHCKSAITKNTRIIK